MGELVNFKFMSLVSLDGEEEKTEFVSKGYKQVKDKDLIYYFKNENEYKFIVKNNVLEVNVNDSRYTFDTNKKREALISSEGYFYKASIITNKLVINSNKIEIEYILDFGSFKGNYKIILELC